METISTQLFALPKEVRFMTHRRAFTLIELLIVVAIIAILAAIAVPNFLEAQVRSKVSRCAADIRSIRTALEAYRVDTNKYPETDIGQENLTLPGVGMIRLTTPISFITSIPKSPFQEDKIGNPGVPKNANKQRIYLYVRAAVIPSDGSTPDSSPADGIDDNYQRDRVRYMKGSAMVPTLFGFSREGFWELKSVGPNNQDDFSVLGDNARIYDPTNGTVSAGDIVVFSDTQGFAQQRN
jgi:type II secretion system protein G